MDNKCVEKLLETVAFSNGCICFVKLIQREHRHFHPSDDCTPSADDIRSTSKLASAANMMSIPLLDHIIISPKEMFSFKEHNMLPEQ